jgi:uncharacterized protein (PEP-CTERM system associated)
LHKACGLATALLLLSSINAARAQAGMPDTAPGTPGAIPSAGPYQAVPGAAVTAPKRNAQGWATDASIGVEATLTNNANYGFAANREGDLIFDIFPSVTFSREGARLRVNGTAALNMVGYVNGVQTSRILPQANILANLEAVERLFFIDASLLANQNILNPFLPRTEAASTFNQFTYVQGRLAPYLKGNIGQNINWRILSDNSYTYTTQSDNPLGNGYFGRQLVEIDRTPTPLGLTLRASSDISNVQGQVQPSQTLNTALAILNYSFTPQLTAGLRGGYENTNYTASETSGPIYGANIAWRPSPVSNLIGYWEQRFYGPSYQFEASHRQRMLASSLSGYRTISTYPQLLLQIPPTGNVSGLLDAILIARFPDPVDRATQVQDLINRQALPDSLPAGAFIYSQNANIITSINANFALIGVRNTLAFNMFYLKTELLPDSKIPPTFLVFNNNIQEGAGLTLSHRLTPLTTVNGTLSGVQTRGFDQNEGLSTKQGLAQFQVNWQLTSRNTLFAGARYQYQKNYGSASAFGDTSEAAIFSGFLYAL